MADENECNILVETPEVTDHSRDKYEGVDIFAINLKNNISGCKQDSTGSGLVFSDVLTW
jgi:hypothetical protein